MIILSDSKETLVNPHHICVVCKIQGSFEVSGKRWFNRGNENAAETFYFLKIEFISGEFWTIEYGADKTPRDHDYDLIKAHR